MVFAVIEAAPGLSTAGRRRAARTGPAAVLTRSTYESMLATAGFTDISSDDRTAGYRATLAAWSVATEAREADVRAVVGDTAFEERRADRRRTLRAIDDALLSRRVYLAR